MTKEDQTKEDQANSEHRDNISQFLADVKERLNDNNFELRTEHGTNWIHLDDELDDPDPAHPLVEHDAEPDCEADLLDPEPDEEDFWC